MWKTFSILLANLSLVGCSHLQPIPRWEGEIFAGSHEDEGIVRKQAGKVVKGTDPEIDEFMAMRWRGPKGFEGFYETYVLGCEKWKPGTPMMMLQEAVQKLEESKQK